jgi:ABC-type multidrug transport system fused ATPase/permease subunit
MFKYLLELSKLFSSNDKLTIVYLFFLNILTSIFEIAGIASIVPFIGLISDPDFLNKYDFLENIYNYFELSHQQSIIYTGISIIVLFVSSNLTSAYNLWRTVKFTAEQNHKVSVFIMKKYLSQNYNYFLNSDISYISKNILSEASLIAENVLMPLLQLITKVMILISISILLFIINPEVFIYSFISLLSSYFIIYKSIKNLITRYGEERLISNDKRFKNVNDSLKSIKDVKFYNAEQYYLDEFSKAQQSFLNLTAKNTLLSVLPKYLIEIFAIGGLFTVTIYIISLNNHIVSYLPILSVFILAAYRLLPLIQQIYVSFSTMKFFYPVLKIMEEVNNLVETKIIRPSDKLKFNHTIEFSNISFSYGEKLVLSDISFDINKSDVIGLFGKSGVGKTTLLDLLLGFNNPSSGQILIDGKVLNKKDIYKICNSTGYVSQNVTFLDSSIAKNIAFGVSEKNIDYNLINKLIDCVRLRQLVDSLEDGVLSTIGESGAKLSGGQCQRLGIARALYLNPSLIIFDEATNALDPDTEKEIINSIKEFTKNEITIFMITHRLSSANLCDKVLILHKNNIASFTSKDITADMLKDSINQE